MYVCVLNSVANNKQLSSVQKIKIFDEYEQNEIFIKV